MAIETVACAKETRLTGQLISFLLGDADGIVKVEDMKLVGCFVAVLADTVLLTRCLMGVGVD